jgi:hypothetical protein
MVRLLTFLGTSVYQKATVKFGEFETSQELFPLALLEFLKMKENKDVSAAFFLTEEAMKTYDRYNVEGFCLEKGINVQKIRISEDESVTDFVRKAAELIDDGDEVILDVTNSFRSITMTAVVIYMFLRELKKVEMKVLYGKYDRTTNVTECMDITDLIDLADWIYATRLFKEFGYASILADKIKSWNARYYKQDNPSHKKPRKLKSLADAITSVSEAIRLGSIRMLHKSLNKFLGLLKEEGSAVREDVREFIPQFDLLFDAIVDRYEKFFAPGDSAKNEPVLSENELNAERELLKFYYETNDLGMATRLAREYLKNVVLFKEGKFDKLFDVEEREAISVSNDTLAQARNHIAHFGFNKDSLPSPQNIQREIQNLIEKDFESIVSNYTPSKQLKAILSPLGTTPGALYTVLKSIPGDLLVIVTSEQGEKLVPEIIEKAEFKGEYHVILVNDPFKGLDETSKVVQQATERLKDATELVINLTGGTTLLNYMIERIRDSVRHGKKIKTVIAYDERPYDEQRKEPYIVGNILELPK